MGIGYSVFQAVKFSIKHPLFGATVLGSGLAAYEFGQLFDVSILSQLVLGLTLSLIVFAVYCWLNLGYGAVYVWFGLHPITGRRTCVYVGLTTTKPYTDRQGQTTYPRTSAHIMGSEFYGTQPKAWSDTVTDWHFAHESYWMPFAKARKGKEKGGPVLRLLEFVNIRLRKPLYNDLMNRDNPRYINKDRAAQQREQRDANIMTDEYRRALTAHLAGQAA